MPAAAKSHRQLLTDLRRTEILDAALKVFGSKGYEAARMDDVAVAAHIAKGTLYLYFSSKEEIYTAAVHQAIDHLSSLTEERLAGVSGLAQRLESLIALRLEFWCKRRSLYRMLLTVGRAPAHSRQTQMVVKQAAHRFEEIMQEAIRSGEIPSQPLSSIAFAIVDMMRGATERRINGLSKSTPAEDAHDIARIALAALISK